MILAIFHQQVASILPTNFLINWPFSGEKCKIDFQDGGHGGFGFPIKTILAILEKNLSWKRSCEVSLELP